MFRRLAITAMIGLACSANAQTFNIDIDPGGTAFGAGVPINSFGAASNAPGYWNAIQNVPGLTSTLRGLNGALTSVTVQTSGTVISYSANDSSATGEFAKLMEDGWKTASSGDSISYTINGLSAGSYFIYTFGDAPDSNQQVTRVTINGSFQNCGGSHNTNEFIQNVTHTRHFVEVPVGGSLVVSITNNPFVSGARAFLAGMQIEKLPERLYVNGAAAAGGDGLSWATAFQNPGDALADVGNWGGAIKEIWVAGGTYYTPNVPILGYTFRMVDGVAMYGGFAGTETQRSQRNTATHPTMLSGAIGTGSPTDNAEHVIMAFNCGANTLIDGFIIADGYSEAVSGGDPWDGYGGGIYIQDSQLTLRGCIFWLNYAWRGGAMVVENSTPRLEGCNFFDNTAEQSGGAVYTLAGGAPKMAQCVFEGNRALVNYGGAIAHIDGTNMYLANCRFWNNTANWGGGGIFTETGNCVVMNCLFDANVGTNDRGGAIHTFGDCYLFVYNSTVVNNSAFQCGGIDAFVGGQVFVRNSIVYGNTDQDPTTNTETAQLRRSNDTSTLTVAYCAVQAWSGILGGTGNFGSDPQFVDPLGDDNIPGTFDDDFRLLPSSPCIDRGSNSLLPADWADVDGDNNTAEFLPVDLDFNARRVDDPATADLGAGTAPIVDIGAYEFVPPCDLPGDLDHDGTIALNDLAVLLANFGTLSGAVYEDGDLDGDGDVDLTDLAVLLAGFGTTCG